MVILFVTSQIRTKFQKVQLLKSLSAVALSDAVIHCYGEGPHQVFTKTIDPNPKCLTFYVHNICYGPHTLISTAALHSTCNGLGVLLTDSEGTNNKPATLAYNVAVYKLLLGGS